MSTFYCWCLRILSSLEIQEMLVKVVGCLQFDKLVT